MEQEENKPGSATDSGWERDPEPQVQPLSSTAEPLTPESVLPPTVTATEAETRPVEPAATEGQTRVIEPGPSAGSEGLPAEPAPTFTEPDSRPVDASVPTAAWAASSPTVRTENPVPLPAETLQSPKEATERSAEPAPDPASGGPNWMLAFVCAWAGATALNEAWAVVTAVGMTAQVLRNQAFLGYGLLGIGLLVFAIEALRWGSRRRGAASLIAVVVPALMTLAGVVALILSQDPGRRI